MFTKKIDNHFFLALTIFIFGIFIAYDRSSNFSDGDAYSLINSYLGFFIDGNTYSPSRGAYGHPIPEILIGFISFNFGTKISNIVCFFIIYSIYYLVS